MMFLEIRHLRSLLTIAESGSLARAAEKLHLTQSALSHQIKATEAYFDIALFLRKPTSSSGRMSEAAQAAPAGSPPRIGRINSQRLTPAGRRLVELAEQVLPSIDAVERQLKQMAAGRAGRLHITLECHACFEWLLPTLDRYRQGWPEVEVDIRLGMSFDPIPALTQGDVDLVITSDPVDVPHVVFEKLFGYQALLAVARDNPLALKPFIVPQDFADQTLITYPVDRRRLDVFTRFLGPAGIQPAAVRQAELTAMILQLVASRRGVAVLPDWVLHESLEKNTLATRPLGKAGMHGTLYAAMRGNDRGAGYIDAFIALARRLESKQ